MNERLATRSNSLLDTPDIRCHLRAIPTDKLFLDFSVFLYWIVKELSSSFFYRFKDSNLLESSKLNKIKSFNFI